MHQANRLSHERASKEAILAEIHRILLESVHDYMQLDIDRALPAAIAEYSSQYIYGLYERSWGIESASAGIGLVFFKLDRDQFGALGLSENDAIRARFLFDPRVLLRYGAKRVFDRVRIECFIGRHKELFLGALLPKDHIESLFGNRTTAELERILDKLEKARLAYVLESGRWNEFRHK
jgi:hypothetical protein